MKFNLRVYGIIINKKDEVLVADERKYGRSFTKFPGGGLEWGEGQKEALKRELIEELYLDSEIGDLFYVNEFFQKSSFRDTDQVFCFYYRVSKIDFDKIPVSDHEVPLTEEGEKFRWIAISELNEEMFTFPIDKLVVSKIPDTSLISPELRKNNKRHY